MLRFTGDYGPTASINLDNLCSHQQMPAGMVVREEGGARPDQWLMVLFHGPAEVSSADGMQWVDADTLMIWPPGPRQVLGHAREPWDHSWIFARGARLQAVVEASGCHGCIIPCRWRG